MSIKDSPEGERQKERKTRKRVLNEQRIYLAVEGKGGVGKYEKATLVLKKEVEGLLQCPREGESGQRKKRKSKYWKQKP